MISPPLSRPLRLHQKWQPRLKALTQTTFCTGCETEAWQRKKLKQLITHNSHNVLKCLKKHLHGFKQQLGKINIQRLMHKSVQRPLLWFKFSMSLFSSIQIWFKVKSTLWGHDRTIGRALLGQTKPTTREQEKLKQQQFFYNSVHVNITHFHWVKKPEIIQSFTLVYKEKLSFSLQFPYRSKNK